MIKTNCCLLSAGFSLLLISSPVPSQSQPLTKIQGTEFDQTFTVTQSSENRHFLEIVNASPEITISPASFSLKGISQPVSEQAFFRNDNNRFEFQEREIILAHNGATSDQKWMPMRPDGNAPIGVMGDHLVAKGKWMVSYRYSFMSMDGNRDGTDNLTTDEVLNEFPVTPEDMTMEMHMFGVMYAPADNLTLMAMLPFVSKEMDHITRRNTTFTTESEGLGDLKFTGLYQLFNQNRQSVHLNLGFSVPTGSIDERDDTPAGDDVILPYPMQIGSGTLDLRPGIAYLGQTEDWSWGAQANAVLRLGENDRGYTVGNRYQLTGWAAHQLSDQFSVSLRLDGETWEDYDGADPALNPDIIPTADPNLRGGTRFDLGLGLNVHLPNSDFPVDRLAVEFEVPLYQSLDGPQLKTDWQLTLGIKSGL